MLLSESARNIYLTAKANLTCDVDALVPAELAERAARSRDPDQVRSRATIDQLSLLRTALRNDIDLSTKPYDAPITDSQAAFLRACKVDLGRAPWSRALAQTTEQTPAGFGHDTPNR